MASGLASVVLTGGDVNAPNSGNYASGNYSLVGTGFGTSNRKRAEPGTGNVASGLYSAVLSGACFWLID